MKHTILLAAVATLLAGSALAATPAGTKLADEANAASTQFKLTVPAIVSYGAGSAWVEKTLEAGAYACHPSTFGLPGTMSTPRKQCKYTLKGGGVVVVAPPVVTPTLVKIAAEFEAFSLAAPSAVTFGLDGKTVTKTLPAGTQVCSNDVFGTDPVPGTAKVCTAPVGTATTPVAPVAPAEPVVVAPPASGSIADPAEYRRVAPLMGTQSGVDYLYGTAAGKVPTNAYPGPRESKSMRDLSIQNPNGLGNRGCGWGDGSWCGTWQLGGPMSYVPGDYSSSILNFAYIPFANLDKTKFKAARYWGVGAVQQVSFGHGTASVVPEVSWTTYEGEGRNNAHNEEQMMKQLEGTAQSGQVPFDGRIVATARGYGRGGWVNNVLFVGANGYITSHGSNTSRNTAKIKLPDGQTPTAIAVTNSGEFALVTTWDTAALRGKVFFIAMKDGCAGCVEAREDLWERNWGSARQVRAGMPGLGNYIGGKVLGSIDLPSDIIAPTGISVTTGRSSERHDGYETVMNLWDEPWDTAAQRARFFNGDLMNATANTGMAVVISKGEKRAAFIDLKPLFTQFRNQWLGPMSDAEFRAKLAARGDGDAQFPPGFNAAPAQKPVVIKTMALPSAPTVVRAMLTAPFRAVVGTEDGNLHVVDLGTNYLNQALGAPNGSPADIKELSTYNVGANPVSVAFVKGKSSQAKDGKRALWDYTPDDSFLWALSRGEKKASMIQWNADRTGFSGTYLTVQDSRMTDPIALEDADNHGTESYVVSIANKDSILNYMYGPLIMWTFDDFKPQPCPPSAPCGPTVKKSIEFAGEFKVPGNVFSVAGANIN